METSLLENALSPQKKNVPLFRLIIRAMYYFMNQRSLESFTLRNGKQLDIKQKVQFHKGPDALICMLGLGNMMELWAFIVPGRRSLNPALLAFGAG